MADWTEPSQPPSPSYLRILHAGRILQDDTTLSCESIHPAQLLRLANGLTSLAANSLPVATAPTNPTVIHISVRSFSIRAEEGEFQAVAGRVIAVIWLLTAADPKKGSNLHPSRTRSRAGEDEVGGCKCIIM